MHHLLIRTLMLSVTILTVSFILVLPSTGLGSGEELFQAIRNGDTVFIKTHLSKSDLAIRDKRGNTVTNLCF